MNQPIPSAEQAIDEARETWQRGYRDAMAAGREIPVVDVPGALGDTARASVEATQELARLGNRRSYVISIDLAAMERDRLTRLARAVEAAASAAAKGQRPSRRKRRQEGKRNR